MLYIHIPKHINQWINQYILYLIFTTSSGPRFPVQNMLKRSRQAMVVHPERQQNNRHHCLHQQQKRQRFCWFYWICLKVFKSRSWCLAIPDLLQTSSNYSCSFGLHPMLQLLSEACQVANHSKPTVQGAWWPKPAKWGSWMECWHRCLQSPQSSLNSGTWLHC